MADYVLVFTAADDCMACQILEMSGFYQELFKLEGTVVGEIMYIKVEKKDAPIKNYNRVFSMHFGYPNYKLMKTSVFNTLIKDISNNDRRLIEQIHFMNAVYNPASGLLEQRQDYKTDIEGIKNFCLDSINSDRRGPLKTETRIAKSKRPVMYR